MERRTEEPRSVTVIMPAWMADALELFAGADKRSRSNEIVVMLDPLVRERLSRMRREQQNEEG